MKKNLLYYIICWIGLVALFNLVCFVTPDEFNGSYKFAGAFWSGYGFIMATFVAHLIYALIILSEKEQEKRILNMPIIIISCVEIMLMVVCGTLCMVIPDLPNWVGIIVCSSILVFSVISLVVIRNVGENSSKANMKLNAETEFYRTLTDTAQLLLSFAKSPEVKAIAISVKDAIRYSDPVSSDDIHSMELEIEASMNLLLEMIKNDESIDMIKTKSEELLNLIEYRNKKCMTLKRQRV